MPFSSNPLMAPVFQSPVGDGRDHRPPVVSIKRAEDAVESGIRLHHNKAKEGYFLQPEVEGLGVAPVEVQTAALASGGSVARHARLVEGDVFLPITLASPVPSALPGMFDALVDIVRPGQRDENGLPLQFEVVVFDPYGQETRSRRLIFESGLGDPVRVNHHIWRTSITGRFVDPFWYGQVRELRRTLGSVDKKFITAHRGDGTGLTYEWAGERGNSASVKSRDGDIIATNHAINGDFNYGLNGWSAYTNQVEVTDSFSQMWGDRGGHKLIHTNTSTAWFNGVEHEPIDVVPGDWVAVKSLVAVEQSYGAVAHYRLAWFDANGNELSTVDSDRVEAPWYDGTVLEACFQAPVDAASVVVHVFQRRGSGAMQGGERLWVDRVSIGVADSEQAALDQVAEYFDGDTPPLYDGPGAYEFPFFPVRIGGSVVQGEYELQVEGDAPAYWSGVITPPGEDLLIQNAKGERIFVQGRVDEPILIQTRPQEQDITLADGTPIWDRIDPGDDDFFPLNPGRNTVHVSMVGATQQSEILIRYREAFYHSLGGGR